MGVTSPIINIIILLAHIMATSTVLENYDDNNVIDRDIHQPIPEAPSSPFQQDFAVLLDECLVVVHKRIA